MNKLLSWLSIIVGLAFLYLGYYYLTHTAGSLPHYFPGYTAGYDHIHHKHAIASFIVGIALFIYAWFASAPKKKAVASGK